MAPVGKSGPLIYLMSPWTSISGFSKYAIIPFITSPRLWGCIELAIPTAIPCEPLTKRLGKRLGKTTGSFNVSSKFGLKSTVSLLKSLNSSNAIFDIRASV